MKPSARLFQRIDAVRQSYWFLPSLMAVGAVLLAAVTLVADQALRPTTWDGWGVVFYSQAEGARSLLSTIAGSMITVAGVTFSITIAAVSYASAQYGPRILGNFMRDRGNQITLGTFIATFLYCLILMRTVRGASEDGGEAFVPHLSVLVGMLLALASLGVLIYFIHHVTESMYLPRVVARIGRTLVRSIEREFPEMCDASAGDEDEDGDGEDGDGDEDEDGDGGGDGDGDQMPELPAAFYQEARAVHAGDDAGYVQKIDVSALVVLGQSSDLLIQIVRTPGDFVQPGAPLALVWSPERASDDTVELVRMAFAWGAQRSITQDLRFPADELVEIAARALSPGVNDPFSAINCMDWLGTALLVLGKRRLPSAQRRDEDGVLRLLLEPLTFANYAATALAQMRPYAASDRNAALHQLAVIADLVAALPRRSYRRVLLAHAHSLMDDAAAALSPDSVNALRARMALIVQLAQAQSEAQTLAIRHAWESHPA